MLVVSTHNMLVHTVCKVQTTLRGFPHFVLKANCSHWLKMWNWLKGSFMTLSTLCIKWDNFMVLKNLVTTSHWQAYLWQKLREYSWSKLSPQSCELWLASMTQNTAWSRPISVLPTFGGPTITYIQDCQKLHKGQTAIGQSIRLCSSWYFRYRKVHKKPCKSRRKYLTLFSATW